MNTYHPENDPANPDPLEVPANLIWHFRIDSLAANGLLWIVTGTAFGFLADRALRAASPIASPAGPTGRDIDADQQVPTGV